MAKVTLISRADLDAEANKPNGKSGRRRSPERTAAIEAFKEGVALADGQKTTL